MFLNNVKGEIRESLKREQSDISDTLKRELQTHESHALKRDHNYWR